jgi:ATP-binding cassette subfamily B protein
MRELRPLRPYLSRYTGAYAAGLACVVTSNLLTTLAPRFIQQGIDALQGPDPIAGVRRAALLIVAVATFGGLLRYAMRQILNRTSRRVEYDLRNALFAKLLRLPAPFYDRMPTGDLMARATNDLLSVRMVAGPALMYLVDTVTRAMILIPVMFLVDPRLAALALAPLLALPLVEGLLGRRIHERSSAIQHHFGRVTDFVHQNVSGVRIVRAYGQETRETEAFARLNREYVRLNLSLANVQAALDPGLALLGGLSAAIALLVGGRLVLAGTVTEGEFVAFFVYLALLIWPLVFLGWAYNLTLRGGAAMRRLNEVFAEEETIASPEDPLRLEPGRTARSVTFENVWFRYPASGDRPWVLEDVSFHVPARTSLAIVGQTGAGKTALAELLVRLYDPDRGRVLIDGIDIRQLAPTDVRNAIGFVPQETFLFSETLEANVLMGAPPDGLASALAVSHLAEALPDLPQGLDSMLGERGINLSGGQRQRAAIARALARNPSVVLLDDSLSAVDSETEARILHELRGALAGRTVVIISHRAAAVRESDLILVLDRGRAVERGDYAMLLANGGRFAELVRRQLLEDELDSVTATDEAPPA